MKIMEKNAEKEKITNNTRRGTLIKGDKNTPTPSLGHKLKPKLKPLLCKTRKFPGNRQKKGN